MLKRSCAFALFLAALIGSPFLYAADNEVRLIGGPGALNNGDMLLGSGYYDSAGGRRVYGINMNTWGFPQDNAIKGGNANLYGLSYGVAPSWSIPYFGASGALGSLSLGTSGYCLKSAGASSAPTWGACSSGSSAYDPAAVAITGGSINGSLFGLGNITPISVGYINNVYASQRVALGGDSTNRYYFDPDVTLEQLRIYTRSDGNTALATDNTPMIKVTVNVDNTGTVNAGKILLAIESYLNRIFSVDASGNIVASGSGAFASGITTSVADGYRRANINNTGAISFTPAEGDYWIANGVFYAHLGGATVALTTGGATVYTDDFDRANENPIATNWSVWDGGGADVGHGYIELYDNQVQQDNTSWTYNSWAYRDSETYPTNHYSQATLKSTPTANGAGGPCVRMQMVTGTYLGGYCANIVGTTTMGVYATISEEAVQQIGTNITAAFADGDIIKLSVSGSVLTVFRNGTQIGQVTDSTGYFTSGGVAGIVVRYPGEWDDWSGGGS